MIRKHVALIAVLWIIPLWATGQELRFTAVPGEQSGLTHVINTDAKVGELKYPWMSPPIDINGDGHLDLLLYGHHGGGAAVWLGKGNGTFTFDAGGYQQRWTFGGRDPIWLDLRGKGAADAIGTEGAGVTGRFYANAGDGTWKSTGLLIGGGGIGGIHLADLDGDGRHREVFITGVGAALALEPALTDWIDAKSDKLKATELWTAEPLVGWPQGLERGAGPGRSGFRDAYAVDLDGDDRNELILHLKGIGFDPVQLYTYVLTREGTTWKDSTGRRGLPTGEGRWLFPEDINVDGSLDLVNLHSGHWYANDGKGHFVPAATRLFDPEKRLSGRKEHPWTTDCELQWLDLDNNGFRDFVSASDHGTQRGVFLNQGGGRFMEVAPVPGSRRDRKFGDVNGDGRVDMVVFAKDRLVLQRNDTPYQGLSIRLVPKVPADAALGAKVWVYEAGRLGDAKALIHYRQGFVERDGGRSNILVPLLHVGLGDRGAADVRVRFPSGEVREARGVKAGTLARVLE